MTVVHCGLWVHDTMMSCRWFLNFGGTHCLILPDGSHFTTKMVTVYSSDTLVSNYQTIKQTTTVRTFIAQ